jgi:hypothetical protein
VPHSLYEPQFLLRIIKRKKRQLAEIEEDLLRLPLDHPTRLRWLERRLNLQQGIPALEAEYARRTGDSKSLHNERQIPSEKESVRAAKLSETALTQHQEMPLFRWEDVDHSLVSLRLTELAEEMRNQIEADERRIQFENRGNLNSNTVPSLVLEMKQNRADDMARRVYEIYSDVWKTQGHAKSAAFVRAVYLHGIVPVLRGRTGGIASDFAMFATRTSFPIDIGKAHLQSHRLKMLRLESRWHRRIEIEAKELEHFERTATLAQQEIQRRNVATKEAPMGVTAEGSRQIPSGRNLQRIHEQRGVLSTGTPGRRPRLDRSFVECAGTLWQKATSDGHSVPLDRLRPIASELDAAGYLPPSKYLEAKYAMDLKAFNSRNSNSKLGPIKTWSELTSRGDKDHLRGMRRLLSRCAGKLDGGHQLSGN